MFELILMTALAAQTKTQVAQFKPCVWPNKCAKIETVAQVQTCQWPNKCGKKKEVRMSVAQFQPCVWPRTCKKTA